MHRSQDILAHHALVEHDGVLIVVALPWHVGHEQIAAQSKLAVLCSIAFGQDVALLHPLAFLADRPEVDGHVLVRTAELRNAVFLQCRLEADELFVLRAVVHDLDGRGVYVFNDAVAFGRNHGTRIFTNLLLYARADNRGFGTDEGHGLTHHVRTHQSAVGVVVFKERNQRGRNRGNLLRSHVNQLYFGGRNDRIVRILAAFHLVADKRAVVVQRSISLTDDLAFLFFGSQVNDVFILQVDDSILHLAVGRLDKAKVINLRINTKRGDKTDIRAFGRLNRAKAAIVSIVNVTDLETGTLARQTARTQRRETALVGHFGQRVRLVHELRQGVRAEE